MYMIMDTGLENVAKLCMLYGTFFHGIAQIMILTFPIHSLHLYYSQAAYGGYIFEYAVKNQAIEISSTDGAYMTSVYWGSFALGRLISIPISTFCSLSLMLLVNLVSLKVE